ncbi:MAG: hypothetical protein HQ592_07655 [Planctomycetes bacterium]|nr:hypothetical protein [Planctomycetota bacterium]
MEKYAASTPRKMFWSTEVGGTSKCPECGDWLEPDSHSYLMMIRDRRDVHPFVVGSQGGHFCPQCPSVVLDRDAFLDYASVVHRGDAAEFVVVGLIDSDAVPEDKRHVPFGDDNPIPLVKFTNIRSRRESKGSAGSKMSRRLNRRRKKRR